MQVYFYCSKGQRKYSNINLVEIYQYDSRTVNLAPQMKGDYLNWGGTLGFNTVNKWKQKNFT